MTSDYKDKSCQYCHTINKNVPKNNSNFFKSKYPFRCLNCYVINGL